MPKVFLQPKGIWVTFPDDWDEERIRGGVNGILTGAVPVPGTEKPPGKPAGVSTELSTEPKPSLMQRAGRALSGINLGTGEEGLYGHPLAKDPARAAYDQFKDQTGINPESDLRMIQAMASDMLKGVTQGAAATDYMLYRGVRAPVEWLLGGIEEATRPTMTQEQFDSGEPPPESAAHKAANFPLKALEGGAEFYAQLSGLPEPALQFLGNTAEMLGSLAYLGPAFRASGAAMAKMPEKWARPFFRKIGTGMGAAAIASRLDVTDENFPETAALFMAFEAAPFIARAGKRAGKEAFERATRKTVEEAGLPQNVFVSAEKVRDMFQTGEKISPEEAQMVRELGLPGKEYREAIERGLHIRIPAETILRYGDRPWFAKLKQLFGREPFLETRRTGGGAPIFEYGPSVRKAKTMGEEVMPREEKMQGREEGRPEVKSLSYLTQDKTAATTVLPTAEMEQGVEEGRAAAPTEKKAEEGVISPGLLRKKQAIENQIEALDRAITRSNETDIPGTYVTGGSGVPYSRIKKVEKQLDRRIDRAVKAVKLKKDLAWVNARIAVQRDAPKRAAMKEAVRNKLEEAFSTIEVGDMIDIGGNAPLTVIKKNAKSVITEGGTKWTASEIGKVIKAGKPEAEPEVERKTPPREPWEVTREEYLATAPRLGKYHSDEFLSGYHKQSVISAMSKGRPVHPEALSDYPDLIAGGEPKAARTEPKPKSKPPDKRGQKFREFADKMQKEIDDKRRPMTQNPTPKRMREYRSRVVEGNDLERAQQALRAMADAHEAGALPEILKSIMSKSEVLSLVRKGTESGGGYYEVIPSADYKDKSPKGIALQQLLEAKPGAREDQAEKRKAEKIAQMVADVQFKKLPGFFVTPRPTINEMIQRAEIEPGMRVLDPELLGDSPKAADGAPIIGPDGVVESGNGRVIALKRGYEQDHPNMEVYKGWIWDNRERFGLSEHQLGVHGIHYDAEPILVRIRTSDVDRAKFAREANVAGQAAMSAMERALDDAKVMEEAGHLYRLDPTRDGDLNTAHNNQIIKDFLLRAAGKSELGNYVTKEGALSKAAYDRARNAVFAAAYGKSNALEVMAESADDEARNLTRGLLAAAPAIARAKSKMTRGALENVDISPFVARAADKYRLIKESGEKLEHFLRQRALFDEGDIDSVTAEVLNVFDEYRRSGAKIGQVIRRYAELWESLGDPRQEMLFGKEQAPEIPELLARAKEDIANAASKPSPASLFEGQTPGDETAQSLGQVSGKGKESPQGKPLNGLPPKEQQLELERRARDTKTVTLSFLGMGALEDLGRDIVKGIVGSKVIRDTLHNLGIKDKHDGITITDKDFSDWYKYLQMPHDVALQHPEFKPLYGRQRERELAKSILDHAFADKTAPYFNGSDADRKKVDQALVAGEQEKVSDYDPLQLRERFGMNDKQIAMYQAVRDSLDAAGELLLLEMEDAGVKPEAMEEFQNRLAGYVPHKWYGNWAIVVKKPGGVRTVFMTKTTFTDRFKERDRVKALYPGHMVYVLQSKKIPYEAYQDAAPWAVSRMVDMVIERAGTDPTTAEELKQALSDLYKSKGFGQNFIRRKGTPGWTEDLARPLAEYFAGFNGYITKMKAIKGFAEDIKTIDPKRKPNLYRYALDYIRYVTGEQMEFGAAKQAAYIYYLYGNLKSAAVNLTQNMLLGWPVLSKHTGFSGPKMFQAQVRAAHPKMLTEGERNFIKELEALGHLDPKMAVEMGAFTSNPLIRMIPQGARDTGEAIDIFQHAESWNRRAMAVALYDAGIRDVDKAAEIIEEAHFRYAKGNRPVLMRGAISPLMTFRSWAINYITWLKNEIKAGRVSTTARSAAAMLLLGGFAGMPFYNLLKKIWIRMFGEDPQTAASRGMGKAAAQLVFRGAPAKVGISFTGSVGLGDILPTDLKSAGGVFADVPGRVGRVSKDLSARDYVRALEDVSPEAIRQPMAAYRSATKGDTTRSGAPIYDPTTGEQKKLTAGEAATKALGFQPIRSAENYDLQSTVEQIKEARDARKQAWANRYVVAQKRGDTDAMRAVELEVAAYNRKMEAAGRPEAKITRQEMISAVSARKKAGVPPKYMRPTWQKLLEGRGISPSQ